MGDTSISWTDKVWNPTRGCSLVSAGCTNCYAMRQAHRFAGKGKPFEGLTKTTPTGPKWTGEVRLAPEMLALPLRWRKSQRVFVNSMSDLFHEKLTNEQIAAVFGVMAAAPRHTFQVLTKRAKRMREWFVWARGDFTEQQRGIASAPNTTRALLDAAFEHLGHAWKPALDAHWKSDEAEVDAWPLRNVWLGVSVENQDAADERIPELLTTPAAVRFLSCEPLLGEVQLFAFLKTPLRDAALGKLGGSSSTPGVDWVIAGCESGPGARKCKVEWLRSLRDDCSVARVPYFLKQAVDGEYLGSIPGTRHIRPLPTTPAAKLRDAVTIGDGSKRKGGGVIELPYLDGVQHAAFPTVTP